MRNRLGKFVSEPVASRLWARVTKTDTCWIWTGLCTGSGEGYPTMRVNGYPTRVSHLTIGKPRPSPKHVACHTCDTPHCVRPSHLFWDTNKGNIADAVRKGRMRTGPLPKEWRDKITEAIRSRFDDLAYASAHTARVLKRNKSAGQAAKTRAAARRKALSGIGGVSLLRGKWVARITDSGRETYIGSFDTEQEARDARLEYAMKLYGDKAVSQPRPCKP